MVGTGPNGGDVSEGPPGRHPARLTSAGPRRSLRAQVSEDGRVA